MTLSQHVISGHWEPRSETTSGLAVRMMSLLRALKRINPIFDHWIWAENLKSILSDAEPDASLRLIERHIDAFSSRGEKKNRFYRVFFGNTKDKELHSFLIHIVAGQRQHGADYTNSIIMQTPYNFQPDQAIITYDIFRPTLLALIESFDVSWCRVFSSAMDLPRGEAATPFHRAWMSYVAPHLAPLITPPSAALVENLPNGGIFMAATTETYEDTNPLHRAVSQIIADAVSPLEQHDWTVSLDAQPDDFGSPAVDEPVLGSYTIFGHWGPRAETLDAIACRFRALLDGLAPIDPLFGNWICAKDKRPVPFEAIKDTLAEEIDAEAKSDPDFDHWPGEGYMFFAINALDNGPRSIKVSFHAGCTRHVSMIVNSAEIETPFNHEPDPAMITYAIFKPALLALAETFQMSWCRAYPGSMVKPGSGVGGTPFHRAWMSYVAPDFVPLIHPPPPDAIVEIRPDGGIFMAATTERYDDAIPAHQTVARAIEAAVAPLRDYPWKLRLDEP